MEDNFLKTKSNFDNKVQSKITRYFSTKDNRDATPMISNPSFREYAEFCNKKFNISNESSFTSVNDDDNYINSNSDFSEVMKLTKDFNDEDIVPKSPSDSDIIKKINEVDWEYDANKHVIRVYNCGALGYICK